MVPTMNTVPPRLRSQAVISAPAAACSAMTEGHSFSIKEHILIRNWARRNDHRAVVCLDHGVEDEAYEEAVMLRFGVCQRCRFILLRTATGVTVQPLLGRRAQYGSVPEALAGPLLNKPVRQSDQTVPRRYSVA